jgi:hypothetical protein
VGIGTTNPLCRLCVANAGTYGFPSPGSTVNSQFILSDASGVWGTEFGGDSSGTGWIQQQRFDGNGSVYPLCLQPKGGNVGIGTTAPSAVLDVNGSIRAYGAVTPTTGAGLELSYTSNQAFIAAYDRSAGAYKNLNIGGAQLWLNAAGGYVGIGTSAPTSPLTIIPAANPSSFTTLQMTIGENSNNASYRLYLGFVVNGGYWAGAVNAIAGGAGTHLYLNPSGAYIRAGGTSVPGYIMDIAGDCNVTGVYRVNGTPIATGAAPTTMVSAAPYYCTPTSARGFQASYTNSTSGPVWVTVGLTMPAAFSVCAAYLNGSASTTLASATSSAAGTMVLSFVVLPGQYYYLAPGGTWPTIAYVLEYK